MQKKNASFLMWATAHRFQFVSENNVQTMMIYSVSYMAALNPTFSVATESEEKIAMVIGKKESQSWPIIYTWAVK